MSGKSKSQFPADVDCPRESKKVCIVSNHADDEGLPEIVYLECNEGGSNKFYQIVRNIEEVSISYGKKGFAGTSSIKKFGNEEDAKSYLQKMKSEKLKKGYRDNGEVIASEISNNNISSIDESKSIDATTPSTTVLNGVSETAYLECVVGTSRKFYKLSRKLSQVEITYGRIGDKGVLSVKEFDNVDEALRFVHKTSAEKQKKGYKLISTTDASTLEDTFTLDEDLVVPSKDVDAVATSSTSVHESNDIKKIHLECTENGSDKFYTLTLEGTAVTSSYGRKGTNGTTSVKRFDKMSDALAFMNKTKGEKIRKGYREQANSSQLEPLSGVRTVKEDPVERLADLENGLKVYVQGSSAMPYTCKKFEGGYSCSCQGWGMTVKNKGVQATTCKHLKSIRGEEAEAVRCNEAAGICNPSAKGLRSAGIPGKIALAHQWKDSIDPTGFLMSEKLDGMRAYWTGEKLFTRSGLPILCPDWFLSAFPRNLELDGELFLGRKQFEQCMSITRRTDKGGDWTRISYVVFDAPTVKDGISTRLQVAAASIEEAKAGKSDKEQAVIRVHPHSVCEGIQHVLEELAVVEAQGGEGLMLRHPTAKHRSGRTSDLLKVKSFQDDEALVTAYEPGKGKYSGQVGALVCVSRAGAQFKVGSGLVDSQRSYESAPKVGTVITFKYFELSADGIPRFPTFLRVRPDVSPTEFPSV